MGVFFVYWVNELSSKCPYNERRQGMSKINKLLQQTFIELYETQGWTPKQIADQFNVKERTVITVVEKREQTGFCLCCGKELEQIPGHRQKEFCSPKCYKKWRREHVLSSSAKHIQNIKDRYEK